MKFVAETLKLFSVKEKANTDQTVNGGYDGEQTIRILNFTCERQWSTTYLCYFNWHEDERWTSFTSHITACLSVFEDRKTIDSHYSLSSTIPIENEPNS